MQHNYATMLKLFVFSKIRLLLPLKDCVSQSDDVTASIFVASWWCDNECVFLSHSEVVPISEDVIESFVHIRSRKHGVEAVRRGDEPFVQFC